MKRFVGLIALIAIVGAPISAHAATLASGQQYSLSAQQRVEGSLYAVAGTTTIGGAVTGDVITAGGTVSLTGSVGGDVLAVGGTIQILGPVAGDVRVAGGTITLNETIAQDLVVAGGAVHILPAASIRGDLLIAGGQVIIDGDVRGSVRMIGGQLTINGSVGGDVWARADQAVELGSTARVEGKMTYKAPQRARLVDGSVIRGGVSYTALRKAMVNERTPKAILWAVAGVVTGIELLAMLGFASLILWRRRRMALEVLEGVRTDLWNSIGKGLAYGILMPIAAGLLMVSFIGIFPGVLLFMLFVALALITKVATGMLFGAWIAQKIGKHATLRLTWVSGLGGIVLLKFVSFIPVVGWLIVVALGLGIFGALASRAHKEILQ